MPLTMRPCLLAALVLSLAGLPGCTNGRVSEQDDVRATVRTFLDQCAEQRVLNVLPTLVPAGQKVVAQAPSTLRGCARVLRLPAGATLTPAAFAGSALHLQTFDGARARVAVALGGQRAAVVLSRGTERWQIEGP